MNDERGLGRTEEVVANREFKGRYLALSHRAEDEIAEYACAAMKSRPENED